MTYLNGVNLLPSTGEFTYDTIPYLGQRVTEATLTSINRYANGGPDAGTGTVTDYTIALEQSAGGISRLHDRRRRRRLVRQLDRCHRLPDLSVDDLHQRHVSSRPPASSDVWRCSSLTQSSSGLIPIPQVGDAFIYGGTPSDQSIVRCIRDLKVARAARRVLSVHPDDGERRALARRHHLSTARDISSAATTAVDNFLGSAATSQFTPRHYQSDRRLFGLADRLHLSADDPALRQSVRGRRRRRSLLARLGIPRPGSRSRSGLDQGGHDRRRWHGDLGLSVRRRA